VESSGPVDFAGAERRATPVELFWDLAFVFAITQVTHFLLLHFTWGGFLRGMIVLALIWWAWSAFVWAANAQSEDSATMQLALLASLVLIFIAGVAVPDAFGNEATLFALTYSGVRLIHLALYVDASRRGNASWEAITGFGAATLAALALLVAGSFFDLTGQTILWTAALALDYAGPAWLTRAQLRGLQRVAVAHFAERYGLFVIICLGESIVAIGLAANNHPVDAGLLAAVGFGLLATIGLWRTYFGQLAVNAEQRLRQTDGDVVLAAADGYSYLHLLIVAGIVVFATGVRVAVDDPTTALPNSVRLCLCGGIALYLLGHAAFRLRMVSETNRYELATIASMFVLFAITSGAAAWLVVALVAAAVLALCVAEAAGRQPGSHG
jgi:low temperature requirement protein LtrA